jgi:hypothetical protein
VSHPLLARLRSPDADLRRQACLEVPQDPAAVILADALGESLGDPVLAVAVAASDALVALARQQHDVKPVLRASLHQPEPSRRLHAALTWARLEPPEPRLLPALVGGLGLADGKRRWWAAKCLVDTGRLHGQVLPLLVGLSRGDASPVVRRMARHCLRELACDDPAAAQALLEATYDRDVAARRAGYAALAALLDPPDAVFARLLEALSGEPDGACRRIATVALAELGAARPTALGAAGIAALRAAAEDPNDEALRRGARRALARVDAAGAG